MIPIPFNRPVRRPLTVQAAAPKQPVVPPPEGTAEHHAALKGTHPAFFAAAKAMHGWPKHVELSSEEFDAAVEAATNVELR